MPNPNTAQYAAVPNLRRLCIMDEHDDDDYKQIIAQARGRGARCDAIFSGCANYLIFFRIFASVLPTGFTISHCMRAACEKKTFAKFNRVCNFLL